MPYIPRQYDSSKAFLRNFNNLGNIIHPMDIMRVNSYNLFDDLYYNRPDNYKVTLRGDSAVEIYLPSTKKIVDATARYLAVDFAYQLKGGNESAVKALVDNIFKREEIQKKFIKGKRSGLTRGDLVWYITADGAKEKGERISINTIHPSCIFPIEDPNNSYRVIGYHIVDIVPNPYGKNGEEAARRQTFRKENGGISTEVMLFEVGHWDDRYLPPKELKPIAFILKKKMLPKEITSLPVYMIPNNEPDGSTYGMSQLSGMEYIINALNQSITYEDLSLVLAGLGVYVTDGAPPTGKDGKPGKYKLHPGNVLQKGTGETFERISGINSVTPFQDHLKLLETWMNSGAGVPDMAAGQVDVAVAQSGIALALKMGPIIAENEDKQLAIGGRWDHMGYDLIHGWLPAFEGLNSPETQWTSSFGDPMPINRDTYVTELTSLYQAGLLLIEEVRDKLEAIGYKNTAGIVDKLLTQQAKVNASALGDPYGMNSGGNEPNLVDTLGNNGSTVKSSTNGKVLNGA